MKTKTKHSRKYLLAIAMLLIAILTCIALIRPNAAECSEEIISDNAGLISQADAEDFSSYTDQQLPDKIDRNNIKQYVPTERFNTDRYIIYNGRNYGFIIFNDAKTNHVLIFKEVITQTSKNNYEVEFKVLYTSAFFKSGNTILNANSPYSIALSNINFSEFILDAHINETVTNFANPYGPYFLSAGLNGDISFLDKKNTSDNISVDRLDVNSTAKSDKALAHNIADLTVNAVENKAHAASSTLSNNHAYLGFNGYRCIELKVNAGADDFLANKNGKQDYLIASFRIDGIHFDDYYIYNNVSFDICLYNALQVKKEVRVASESIFSPTDNSTSEYGILDRSNDGYTLTENHRFEPLLNDLGVFNFAPDKDRKYKIETPEGYYATINDEISNQENIFAVSGKSNIIGFTTQIDNKSNGGTHGKRLIAQDFIGGEIKFANIEIKREQELKLGQTYLSSEIPTYRVVRMSEMNNNLFTLDTTGYTGVINLRILDENLDIVHSSTRYGKELVINYPFLAEKKYYIVCDNQSYTAQALQFNDRDVLEVGNKKYPSIENVYYKFTAPKYTQYYQTFAKQIVDDQGSVIPINDGDAFLEAGKTYYLQSGISRLMTNISDSHIQDITKLDESIECSQELNEVFKFIPIVGAQYSLIGGTFDIYRNWTLVVEDVDTVYLNESDITYQFVKRQEGGSFSLDIQGDELSLGLNNLSQSSVFGKGQYVFNSDENMRIEYVTNPSKNVYIYDAYLNLVEFEHGYPMTEGKNYIFIEGSESGTIMIEEYLQRVNVDLYVDGQKYEYDRDFYYGKDLILPVPVKDRYNFIGWGDANGLVTDSNGQGLDVILEESMTLTAVWQLRGIVVKFTSNGGFWWNGQAMVNQEVSPVFVDEDIDSIYGKVVSLIESTPECIVEGYYYTSYRFALSSSDALNDYYSLMCSTVKENYRIRFEIFGSYYYTNGAVAYGDSITYSNFPKEVLDWSNCEYAITSWSNSTSQEVFSIRNGGKVGDLTPGIGSKNINSGYTNVVLTANIKYVSYKFNINSNLYEVPRSHSYKIETLEDYGYKASNYYGYNLCFRDNNSRNYYIDQVVFVSDLHNFWSYGKIDVTIDLKIVSTPIKVYISYLGYGDGKLVDMQKNKNATSYQGGTVNLSSVTSRGWIFDCWKCNNVKITQLTYSNLGVNRYYSQSDTVELYRNVTTEFIADKIYPKNSGTMRVDSAMGVARIYGSGKVWRNYTFVIAPSVKELTIVGGIWYDTDIKVEDDESNLILYFDNVYIKAKNNQSVIQSNRFMEFLYSFGTTELVAGDVSADGAQAAIVAKENIVFGGDKFIIRGGNSTNPYKFASYGIKCDSAILSAAKTLEVYGGNGVSGADHSSGRGGHGASAINAENMATMTKESQIICYGGSGGDSINGSKAGDGAVAAKFRTAPPIQCIITYVPGKGGKSATSALSGKDGDAGFLLY
ncbi:MAG: hypothetical protein K2O35_05380 [Clostridia bacterium]|nr:hypothetical protein [Clostridia bacterium]